MKEEDRQKVNYVKAELDNYYHMQKKAIQLNFEAEELWARINRVSGGIAKIPSGAKDSNPHWRSPLFEEVEQLEREIDMLMCRTGMVEKFLNKLSDEDRDVIVKLHVSDNDKRSYESYCHNLYLSASGLKYHVNRIIIKYW